MDSIHLKGPSIVLSSSWEVACALAPRDSRAPQNNIRGQRTDPTVTEQSLATRPGPHAIGSGVGSARRIVEVAPRMASLHTLHAYDSGTSRQKSRGQREEAFEVLRALRASSLNTRLGRLEREVTTQVPAWCSRSEAGRAGPVRCSVPDPNGRPEDCSHQGNSADRRRRSRC